LKAEITKSLGLREKEEPMDRTIICADCHSEFTFTESEQSFYAERNFSDPRRCPSCRAAKKSQREAGGEGGYSGSSSYSDRGSFYGDPAKVVGGGAREYFTATCSSCGKEARVPFRPNGTKPVYCSDCFRDQHR
jgi:CxxC-x17-CxxC domain-containing protein